MPKTNSEIQILASTHLPTQFGMFTFGIFQTAAEQKEHIFLTMGEVRQSPDPVLTRIHSACETGECFLSLKCDCGEQLHTSMELIQKVGRGLIIYLNQEGRGIGLVNKIKAYALQEKGLDTIQANEELHLPVDSRSYQAAIDFLVHFGITKVKLITNNPGKIQALKNAGIQVTERIAVQPTINDHNAHYLRTKKQKLGHLLDL